MVVFGRLCYNREMKILAIESSCDETAAAVIENGTTILSNVVVSQVDIFAVYGGVIPEVAARSHLEAILPVIHKALDDARLTKDDIDCIAVTHTPGLLGSLLIGTLTARTLAILWKKSLYAVHHLKSHIYSNWLGKVSAPEISASADVLLTHRTSSTARSATPAFLNSLEAEAPQYHNKCPEFPLLALVVSGGHTQIIYMRDHNQFEIIGTTRDDAVGECFDKVAKILGLPYPGGPNIAKVASSSRFTALGSVAAPSSYQMYGSVRCSSLPCNLSKNFVTKNGLKPEGNYKLPKPKIDGLDFSFSGLKTAVLRAVQHECGLPITTPSYELAGHLSEQQKADFAAAFQETACEILVDKLKMALEQHPEARSVVLAGGVSANKVLRERVLETFLEGSGGKIGVYFPELQFTGDNAAMVGAAAYFEIENGVQPTDPYKLNIAPRTPIQ